MLLFSQLTSTKGLGPIGAIGIVAAMITILTFLPAALVLFGRWIFWPRKPRNDGDDHVLSGPWSKVANGIERKPRRAWVITGVILVGLAFTSTTLKADGLGTVDTFTGNPESVVGQKLLVKHFPGGEGDPTQIVVAQGKADAVIAAVSEVKGVSEVSYAVDPMTQNVKVVDGKVILNATLDKAPDSVEAGEYITPIREAAKKADSSALVGGTSAVYFDVRTANGHDNKTIIPIILFVITIILGLLLRSILSAVVLLGTVVLSYFATLGACALVFNHVFKFAGGDNSFPLFAFIFLVALGIDYNIFLMTRVREEAGKIGTRAGITKGVTVTGAVITSAGIVLAATFAVLGLLPLVPLAELGFAVAFGVLLDTLIVRTILVPALVHEIGPKIWWPSKLQKSE
jgi:RND superfamily putative drug exporter